MLRRFDVPRAGTEQPDPSRALVGAPSSAIGRILCADSDVTPGGAAIEDPGYPLSKPKGPSLGGVLRRALFFGLVGGVVGSGIALGLDALDVVDVTGRTGAGILGLTMAGALALAVVLTRLVDRFDPETIYVGQEGIERVTSRRGALERVTVVYGDVARMTRGGLRLVRPSERVHSRVDKLVFVGEDGEDLLAIESSTWEGRPSSPRAQLVQCAADAYHARRLALAEARLRDHGSVEFAMERLGQTIVVTRDTLEIRATATEGTPSGIVPAQRLAISDIAEMTLAAGVLELVPRSPPRAPIPLGLAAITDGEVFVGLMRARGVAIA
ncbi:MAG: hypothetical protein M3Y87_20915 [Myxococcota bacterium]|nr:hypothetical protein [Myxococcota bacterium]